MSDQKQAEEVEEVTGQLVAPLICDICGISCFESWGFVSAPMEGSNHCAHLFARWGYGSPKDLEVHKCCMCESCYDKVAAFITGTLGGKIRIDSYVPSLAMASK